MAVLTSQPTTTPTIDTAGLGKGMQMLLVPSVGTGLVDLVTSDTWSLNGGASIATVGAEKHFKLDSNGDYLSAAGYSGITGNVGTFFAFYPVVGDLVAYGSVFISTNSPSTKYFQISNYNTVVAYPADGSPAALGSWFNTTGRSFAVASGGAADSTAGFINGLLQPITFPSAPATWGTGVSKNINIGRWIGGGYPALGTCSIVGWTSEVWTATEAAAFHSNPWAIFSAGGSASSFTITPAGGLVLSGGSGYLRGKIVLPSGNVSLSGGSVPARGREYSPTGGITFSGTAPIGTASSFIIVPEGGVVLSGAVTQSGSHSYRVSPSGGINLSGTSPIASGSINSYTLYPSGGLTASGMALIIKTHIYLPSGSIAFAGGSPIDSNTRVITVTTHKTLTGVGI